MLEIAWKTYLYTWYLFEEGEEVVYRLFTCNLLSVLIVSVRFAMKALRKARKGTP